MSKKLSKFLKGFCKTLKKFHSIRRIVILSLYVILIFNFSFAQEPDFGLGIILGEPTGISFKKWVGSITAIDGGIAWSFMKEGSFHLHIDYLFHNFNLFKTNKGELPFYYGIGGRIKMERKSRLGIRIPIGVSYVFEKVPLDVFFEIGPLLDLIPATEFGVTGGIGIRYYF